MRFYNLGVWSFGFDEHYTKVEALYFFEGESVPRYIISDSSVRLEDTQFVRLPSLVFCAYFVHWLDFCLFGFDEFGSRFLMALMGSFCVGFVFLFGRYLFGLSFGFVLGVMILLWPDHILHSQNCRFYIQSFCCISSVLFLGGLVVVRRSFVSALCLGPALFVMVFTHSLSVLIWGILLSGVFFDLCVCKFRVDASYWRVIFVLIIWSVILFLACIFYIFPLVGSWNNFPTSSIDSIHSAFCLAVSLGWSFFMLFIPAWLFVLFNFRKPGYVYWFVCATLCGLAILILPIKLVYISHYNFLFSFPFFVILALFIDWVAKLIMRSRVPNGFYLACVWVIFVLLSNVPVLASYYQDGGRCDWRAVYKYVKENWQENDRIICFLLDANYYIPDIGAKISIRDVNEKTLQNIIDENRDCKGRIWIPVVCTRYQPDQKTKYWLYNNANYQTNFGKKRYDFNINNVELFFFKFED
ncbi:MAG: hypothetical protein LBP59_05910 [Planctomycetaceae bacterium]|nr:hypothetical protein [Planctomycetaceae bacterium]